MIKSTWVTWLKGFNESVKKDVPYLHSKIITGNWQNNCCSFAGAYSDGRWNQTKTGSQNLSVSIPETARRLELPHRDPRCQRRSSHCSTCQRVWSRQRLHRKKLYSFPEGNTIKTMIEWKRFMLCFSLS